MTDRFTSADAPIMAHPSLSVWEDELFTHGAVVDVALQTHMAQCATCAGTVSALQSLNATLQQSGAAVATYASTHDALRARILDSRARGVRTAIPAAAPEPEELYDHEREAHTEHSARDVADSVPARWWTRSTVRAAAAVLAAIGIVSLWRQPTVAEAGMVAGSLELSPAMPRVGDTVRVTYTTAGLLGKPPVLRLRARIRTVHNDSYNDGVPVVQLAMLHRTSGDRYSAQFVLPDSVVFAALAVEDTAASTVDDFGGRAWEVLRAGADGRPLLDALEQRAHDLMGRSWEEGIATAREKVRLYPDSVRSWNSLAFYEGAMGLNTDSTQRVHREKAHEFAHRMESGELPATPGVLYWYAGHGGDTVLVAQWRERLLAGPRTDGLAVQERLRGIFRKGWATGDTAQVLAELERLWAETPRQRREQVAQVAVEFIGTTDRFTAALRQWSPRLAAADPSIGRRRSLAMRAARIPSMQYDAIAELTALAESLETPGTLVRHLDETAGRHAERLANERAITEARLAQTLATTGRASQAMARLRTLPDVGWNAELFDATARAALAAGDTALALPNWARLRVDPRTDSARSAQLDSAARRYAGDAEWNTVLAATRSEMAQRVMSRTRRRRVEPAEVRTLDGQPVSLQTIAQGQPMLAVFWSPMCGPAVEAMPQIARLAQRLESRGVRVALIAEQATGDAALDQVIKSAQYRGPVYLDAMREANRAFNNWGTPQLYVLDRDGRVVFNGTSSVGLAELYVEALLSSTSTPTNSSGTY